MTMKHASIEDLIDGLAGELEPVRPRRVLRGSIWAASGWAVGAAALLWLLGMRSDIASMPPLSLLSFWLIASAGIAATWSAVRMGLPGVGRDYSGWRWAGLAALSLPLAAVLAGLGDSHAATEAIHRGEGLRCTIQGLVAGIGVGAALFAWLKGGAPTSPTRAGWVVGIAAGAAGATIVALHCPIDNLMHISLWHGLAVAGAAVAGRIILPPLLRW